MNWLCFLSFDEGYKMMWIGLEWRMVGWIRLRYLIGYGHGGILFTYNNERDRSVSSMNRVP